MQTGVAEVPTLLTGPRLFLRSDDPHAGIKKDEQQHEAAHKSPEDHTYQCLPEPHGPHDARGAYRTVTSAIASAIHATALAARSVAVI